MSIFLCGFMGSGKSSLGRKLSEKLKIPFYDLDEYIVENEETTIPEIFKKYGEKKFREFEKNYFKKIPKDGIVSLGGGIFEAISPEDVKNEGMLIFLKAKVDTLHSRLLLETKNRPLLANLNNSQLKEFIKEKLTKRQKDYEKADFIFEVDNKNIDDIVTELIKIQKRN